MTELKRCPFCGSKSLDYAFDYSCVFCITCGCKGSYIDDAILYSDCSEEMKKQKALEAWNNRADDND